MSTTRNPHLVKVAFKMNRLLYRTIILCLIAFSSNNAFSQADSVQQIQTVLVTMLNGDEYTGQIIKKDQETIILKTENGQINLIASKIKSIENQTYTGKFQFANPNDTRYFFGPSGIPIKKREGYYQNLLLTTNFANYGITDNISVGGGFEFISTIIGSPIWFFTPKVAFDISKNIHAGGGIIMAGFAAEGAATLGYGVITLGHSETNISLGVGYGIITGELSDYPAIMISGIHRLSNSIALLSENYLFPNASGDPVLFGIHGIRILSKKNSFDIGGIVIPELAGFIPALPYVGYVRVF